MEQWKISCLTHNGKLDESQAEESGYSELESELNNQTELGIKVMRIYRSQLQRDVIECLLSVGMCSTADISGLTGVDERIIDLYRKSIYKIDTAFDSVIDFLDYIESGIDLYNNSAEEDSVVKLNSFLLKRWSASLGLDFVKWKFKLEQIEYNTASLYNNIMKEAFFYHKEKAMGNNEIPLSEYLKSTNMLLSSVKTKDNIKANNEDEAILDIEERLDIIIVDEAPPLLVDHLTSEDDFINNAVLSDE